MSEQVYHSIHLTTRQCKQLFGYLQDEYEQLIIRIAAVKELNGDQDNTQLSVLYEALTNLIAIQTQLSSKLNQGHLFDEAVQLIDNSVSLSLDNSICIKQYMKNDDCAIYRQYIRTAHGTEPATIYVIMLRSDGGLTIVDNDDMQSHDVNNYEQLIEILTKCKLI